MTRRTFEEWRDVPGYEGLYEVSSLGRVWAARKGRILKNTRSPIGYLYVDLSNTGKKTKKFYVHSLVLLAFVGPRPNDKQTLHRNGVREDCTLANLRYGTHAENVKDRARHRQEKLKQCCISCPWRQTYVRNQPLRIKMKDEQDSQTVDMIDSMPAGFRGTPPMVGWWAVRRVEHLDAPFNTRRWWNGNDWSIPVTVGASDADAAFAQVTPAVHRPDAFEWMGLLEPALDYPYALHAKNSAEAFHLSEEGLAAQANMLRLAYGPEAKEKLERDRSDTDVVQHEETTPGQPDLAPGHSTRRLFNYD